MTGSAAREALRQYIDRVLGDSTDDCARCKTCERQTDAVMAVLDGALEALADNPDDCDQHAHIADPDTSAVQPPELTERQAKLLRAADPPQRPLKVDGLDVARLQKLGLLNESGDHITDAGWRALAAHERSE